MSPTTLLVPAAGDLPEGVLVELVEAIHRETGLRVTPVHLPSPALLPQILEHAADVVAWAPSCVAFVLERLRLAEPLSTVVRAGAGSRDSVLLARAEIQGLADLAGRRVGWVSRFSATGYALPRLYLESFGVESDELFATQRFLGSHPAAAEALARGEVDVIATHSRAIGRVFQRIAARVLVSIGPVPSDVVAAGAGVPAEVRSRLVRGLPALRVGSLEFSPVRRGHFDLFTMLRRHASEVGEHTLSLPHPARLDGQPSSPSRPVDFGTILDGVCFRANSYSSANDTSVI